MAVVVKNTFFDVAEHKFLCFEEPCCADRRSQSLPRTWAPVTFTTTARPTFTTTASSAASACSDLSFYSASECSEYPSANCDADSEPDTSACQSENLSTSLKMNMLDMASVGDIEEHAWNEADTAAGPSMVFPCPTPTGSPREQLLACSVGQACLCNNEMDKVLCYLTAAEEWGCRCGVGPTNAAVPSDVMPDIASKLGNGTDMNNNAIENTNSLDAARLNSFGQHIVEEPEHEPELPMAADCVTFSYTRTALKSEAPAFQPAPADERMDAVANAAFLVLLSCGQLHSIKIEKGTRGQSATLISAEMQQGPRASARCYDIMHIVKQSLEAITARLPTVALVSARVQKEDCGYSLRSAIACLPDGVEDRVCWDLFRKGYCPRHKQCPWYHPRSTDMHRIKVNIKYIEKTRERSGSGEDTDSSSERHKLHLGELV